LPNELSYLYEIIADTSEIEAEKAANTGGA
jgi:hypothetical protein